MRVGALLLGLLVVVGCGDDDGGGGAAPDAQPGPDGIANADGGDGDAGGPDASTLPPPPPTLSATEPVSPASANSPTVSGTSVAGATVRIYGDGLCAGAVLGSGTAGGGGAFAVPLSVPLAADSSTTFHAIASTTAGGDSACSTSTITYVEDSTAPAIPTLTGIDPASPAISLTPVVDGTAEPGATVRAYASAACTGAGLGTGLAGAGGAFSFTVSVPANATTTLHLSASDDAGNTSGCSAGTAYVNDRTEPEPSTLTGTTPASPANQTAPTLDGLAEAGATVTAHADAACAGAVLGSGVAAASTAFSVTVAVPDDSTSTFYVAATDAAGNRSCSSGFVTYVEDSTPPAPPAVIAVTPSSPADDNAPVLHGTATPGTTVLVYGGPGCAGAPLGGGSVDLAGAFDVEAGVPDDSTTVLHATAVDGAGNASACSAAGASYTEDSLAPDAPQLLSALPASPSFEPAPVLAGTAEAGATVTLHAGGGCSGAVLALTVADAAGDFAVPTPAGANTTTTFRARATDAAGHGSACSAPLAYLHDDVEPSPPVIASTLPASPSNSNAPIVSGSAEAGATVRIHAGACTGTPLATGTAAAVGGAFSLAVDVDPDTTTSLRATATDAAGNLSGCGAALAYVEDSTPPLPPVLAAVSPAAPANDNSPTVSGTTEPLASLTIHGDDLCAGAPLGSGIAGVGGSFAFDVPVGDNTQTSLRATTTDAAGNVSACSTSFVTYVEQTASAGPSIAGVVSYAGAATGRIYLSVVNDCSGCGDSGYAGTSVPGPGPYLIRGVSSSINGPLRVTAFLDEVGTQKVRMATHPAGLKSFTAAAGAASGVDVTLVDPVIGAPPAAAAPSVVTGAGVAVAMFEPIVDGQFVHLADHYLVTAVPAGGGAAITRLVAAGLPGAAIFRLPDGGWNFHVRGVAGGVVGPTSPVVSATVAAVAGGQSVSGTVSFGGGGTLYAVVQRTPEMRVAVITSPQSPQPFTIPGVPDGTWDVGAVIDRDDDGVIDLEDVASFEGTPQTVVVAGAAASAPPIALPVGDAIATALTDHRVSPFDGYSLRLSVRGVGRLPVRASVRPGPDLATTLDLPLVSFGDGGLGIDLGLGASAPSVGDTYLVDVTYADGGVDTLSATVTGVLLDAPTPLSPVGSSASDPDPLAPTFSWSAPDPLPAGAFVYGLYLYRTGLFGAWQSVEVPSATTSVAYDFDGRAQESPLLPATTYTWEMIAADADGNRASRTVTFTTP